MLWSLLFDCVIIMMRRLSLIQDSFNFHSYTDICQMFKYQ